MNIQNHDINPHSISKIPRKKLRRIKKTVKTSSSSSTIRKNNGFKSISKSQSNLQINKTLLFNNQDHISPLKIPSSQWFQFDSTILQQYIASALNQFPTFSSIDQLFSLASSQNLETNTELINLLRYASICTLFDYTNGNQVIIREGGQLAFVVQGNLQGSEEKVLVGMQLGENEASLRQKRSVFMEKLSNNEQKYDSSLGRMSQISKQLAFVYRTYLETRAQITSLLKSVRSKVQQKTQKCSLARYAQLLIYKNIKHSFVSYQFDRLNYFKFRQYLQTDRLPDFQNITTFNELKSFLERRKPRRGRKKFLATACSICLSDYFEQTNPLKNCAGCGLRAHQLCYSLDGKRCGSCIYQMLERQVKECVSWCIICRKPGLMVIKLDDLHYAHGFCLLSHGFWRIKSNCSHIETKNMNEGINEEILHNLQEEKYTKNRSQIVFYKPTEQQPNSQGSFNLNHYPSQISQKDFMERSNLSIQSRQLVEIFHFPFIEPSISIKKIQQCNQIRQQHTQVCIHCRDPFFQNCFLVCQSCGKKYHSLCAFFCGFQMRVQERGGIKKQIKLNCCIEGFSRIGWSRRYKLNYQRCAFTPNPADFALMIQDDMWMN